MQHTVILHAETYAIARMDPKAQMPQWALESALWAVTKTQAELSIVCQESAIPEGVEFAGGRRLFEFEGPIPFETTGVLDSVLAPLARAKVSVFVFSTFDTDYFMVMSRDLERAIDTLVDAGHEVLEYSDEE